MSIAQTIRAQLRGDPAERMIRFEGVWYDRAWMNAAIGALEAALGQAGVAPASPIGLVPLSRPEFAAAMVGLFAHERTVVMLYAYQSPEALAHRVRALRLPAVVAPARHWTEPLIAAARETGAAAIALSLAPPGVRMLLPHNEQPGIGQREAPAEPGIDLLTSGTTGAPKHFFISYARLQRRGVVATTSTAQSQAPALSFFPLGNIAGIYWILPTIARGQAIVMLEKFNVADWVGYVREYRPRDMGLPTAAFRMILDAGIDPADLASLRSLATGASTLDPALRREFEARYSIPITQSYGATEFGGVITLLTLADREKLGEAKADSVGRPLPGVQIRTTDPETGAACAPGEEGRLEAIVPAMGDDWIATTDLAMLDADGFLWHRGRLDGAIMRGGFKILPEQITQIMLEHPSVAAAVVVGIADARLGQVPGALLQLRDGAAAPTQADLQAHLRRQLPAIAVPERFRIVPALPRTPSLKIDLTQSRHILESI